MFYLDGGAPVQLAINSFPQPAINAFSSLCICHCNQPLKSEALAGFFFALFTLLVWDAKGQRWICELGITLLLSHLPVVIAICVGVNTTARERCFEIGQTLRTHLSLQFLLSTYVGMLLLRLLYHLGCWETRKWFCLRAPFLSFIMSCSRLCRFSLVFLSIYIDIVVFCWQGAAFGYIAQAGQLDRC